MPLLIARYKDFQSLFPLLKKLFDLLRVKKLVDLLTR